MAEEELVSKLVKPAYFPSSQYGGAHTILEVDAIFMVFTMKSYTFLLFFFIVRYDENVCSVY